MGLSFKSLLLTFFAFKDTAYFGDFFVLSGRAPVISILMSLSLDSITQVWFPSMLKIKRKGKLRFLCWFLLYESNWRTNIDAGWVYCMITVC